MTNTQLFIKPTKLVPYNTEIQLRMFFVLKLLVEISPVIWASLWKSILKLRGLWQRHLLLIEYPGNSTNFPGLMKLGGPCESYIRRHAKCHF